MLDNVTLNQYNDAFEIDYKGTLICYNGNGKEILVPDTVVEIGEGAFCGNNQIEKIVLPSSVAKIGENAFKDCWDLSVVDMSPNVTEIGVAAFSDCHALEEISIPDSVSEILDMTFLRCRRLKRVQLSKNLKVIGKRSFEDCRSLKTILLPEGLKEIKNDAFECTGIEEVTIPGSVDKLEFGIFRRSQLRNTRVLEGCTWIDWSSIASDYDGIKKYYLPSTIRILSLPYDKLRGQSIIYSPINAKIIAFCQLVSGVKWEIDFDNPKTIEDIKHKFMRKKGITPKYMDGIKNDKKMIQTLENQIDIYAREIQEIQQEARNATGVFSNIKRNKLDKQRIAKFKEIEDINLQIELLKNRIKQCEQEMDSVVATLKNISGQELKDIIDEMISSLKTDIEYYIKEYTKRPEPYVSCNYTLSMDSVNKVRNSWDYDFVLLPVLDVSDV